VAGGDTQDELFNKSLEVLVRGKFNLFDVRGADGYKKALSVFALGWPSCTGAWESPDELYGAEVEEPEERLLIVCGPEPMPRFWGHLRKSGALHIGAVFPPFMAPQDPCIIVPDAACVCVLVKDRDFAAIPDGCLDPVLRYTSLKSVWLG
jgi:hypothetical protein